MTIIKTVYVTALIILSLLLIENSETIIAFILTIFYS